MALRLSDLRVACLLSPASCFFRLISSFLTFNKAKTVSGNTGRLKLKARRFFYFSVICQPGRDQTAWQGFTENEAGNVLLPGEQIMAESVMTPSAQALAFFDKAHQAIID